MSAYGMPLFDYGMCYGTLYKRKIREILPFTFLVTVFTISIRIPQLLTIHVLELEQV